MLNLFITYLMYNILWFQPEHKIQSEGGPLSITLQLVPKMLMPVTSIWVPNAFVISFKLETDENILVIKARKALHTYKHKVRNYIIILFII